MLITVYTITLTSLGTVKTCFNVQRMLYKEDIVQVHHMEHVLVLSLNDFLQNLRCFISISCVLLNTHISDA
jgi:hypothetical protein